jgi:hypothetical protein
MTRCAEATDRKIRYRVENPVNGKRSEVNEVGNTNMMPFIHILLSKFLLYTCRLRSAPKTCNLCLIRCRSYALKVVQHGLLLNIDKTAKLSRLNIDC